MENQEKKRAIEELIKVGKTYASIYDEKYQKVAAQAFMDGMQFSSLIEAEGAPEFIVNEKLFRKVREIVDRLTNSINRSEERK
jgi:hypothetical protein